MCVGPPALRTPNLRCRFLKRRLTNTPRRHHLADDQRSSLCRPSARFSSFGAASCDVLFRSSCLFEHTLAASVHYPGISLVVNVKHILTFCEHTIVLVIFDQTDCIVLKSGWSSTARMPASSLVLLPCVRLTPRRHRQTDGQLSLLHLPSPIFSSFGAACVKLSCLLRWSETFVSAVSSSLKCRKYKVLFAVNINIKSFIKFADTVDALTATFAVLTRPSPKGRSSATNHDFE